MRYLFTRKAYALGRIIEAGEIVEMPGDTIPNEFMFLQADPVAVEEPAPEPAPEPEPEPTPEPAPEPEAAPEHPSE
jgi:hypothetical protein